MVVAITAESFSIYLSLMITDIEKMETSEEDKSGTKHTMNEISYFKKI